MTIGLSYMGLFDTILLDPPLSCSRCGEPLELQRFRRLYADVRMWHEHLQRDDPEDADVEHDPSRAAARALARLHRLPDEIRNADDPLAALLARHEEHSPEEDAFF